MNKKTNLSFYAKYYEFFFFLSVYTPFEMDTFGGLVFEILMYHTLEHALFTGTSETIFFHDATVLKKKYPYVYPNDNY